MLATNLSVTADGDMAPLVQVALAVDPGLTCNRRTVSLEHLFTTAYRESFDPVGVVVPKLGESNLMGPKKSVEVKFSDLKKYLSNILWFPFLCCFLNSWMSNSSE